MVDATMPINRIKNNNKLNNIKLSQCEHTFQMYLLFTFINNC